MHTTTPFVNMHTRNVEYLAICLHLWLAISYSAIPTKDMGNVQTCEGKTEYFPWINDTQNLRKVRYDFKNKNIANSFRPNFSSVKFTGETLKYRLRVLEEDDIVAFQIDNVTTADSGEYNISLTYINGVKKGRIGRLDVKENVLGNFNITCENDTETVVCTCGNKTGSDLYTWVFEGQPIVIPEMTTNESKLELGVFPINGSVFCKRRSDCKTSNTFYFKSDHGPTISLAGENIPYDTVAIAVIIPVLIIAIIAATTS
ncbi:uncharacterized protein LOC125381505 [Haliotis rufescens]|uniref:uncharacterized protein LOC125381505 n=1 Tax=Haliotis rufescens TaxID=6454 RepID=UPI00201F85F1|nr:uncharacterized protein LOC125381505 [Haliotis rufescens]